MRRVVLESPYAAQAATTKEEKQREIDENVEYARRCIRDCLQVGDAPIASHLLFTQPGILSDEVPEQRALGMRAGLAWTPVAEAVVVYVDRGVSKGMIAGIARAQKNEIPIEVRALEHDPAKRAGLFAATRERLRLDF